MVNNAGNIIIPIASIKRSGHKKARVLEKDYILHIGVSHRHGYSDFRFDASDMPVELRKVIEKDEEKAVTKYLSRYFEKKHRLENNFIDELYFIDWCGYEPDDDWDELFKGFKLFTALQSIKRYLNIN